MLSSGACAESDADIQSKQEMLDELEAGTLVDYDASLAVRSAARADYLELVCSQLEAGITGSAREVQADPTLMCGLLNSSLLSEMVSITENDHIMGMYATQEDLIATVSVGSANYAYLTIMGILDAFREAAEACGLNEVNGEWK